MFLTDRKVDRIWMPAATGTMYPIPLIPQNMLYLQNFAWFDYIRPLNKDDIFEWRPKKAGSELKESVRHAAPKQRLSDIKKQRGISPAQDQTSSPLPTSPEREETVPETIEENKDAEAGKENEIKKDEGENKDVEAAKENETGKDDKTNDNKEDNP